MSSSCSEMNILHFPAEILQKILSYLRGIDVINVWKACKWLEPIISDIRVFDFSKNSFLNEKEFIAFLTAFKPRITSLNINHCFWLTEKSLNLVLQLPNLKELHMIGCLYTQPIYNKFPLGLTSFSFTWKLMKFNNFKDDTFVPQFFKSMKSLVINVLKFEDDNFYVICQTVLKHCEELKKLKIYCKAEGNRFADEPAAFNYRMGQLTPSTYFPKLEVIYLDLPFCGYYLSIYLTCFEEMFKNKKKLKQLYIANLTATLLDGNMRMARQLIPLISTDEMTEILLHHLSCQSKLNSPTLILKDKKFPNCKKISMSDTAFHNFTKTAEQIVESCPAINHFSLENSTLSTKDMLSGLNVIFSNFSHQLVHLDLTIVTLNPWIEKDVDLILLPVTNLKELKAFYLPPLFFSSLKLKYHQLKKKFTNYDEAMRNCSLWKITECCPKVEDFRLTDYSFCSERYLSDHILGCISNWKHLKKLYISTFDFVDGGKFIERILRNCLKLEVLRTYSLHFRGNREKEKEYANCYVSNLPFATQLRDIRFF
ncbi:hypothetical protein CHUAL_000167 [Chamberlinius hualienensis]